jgi:hypothetical protein
LIRDWFVKDKVLVDAKTFDYAARLSRAEQVG